MSHDTVSSRGQSPIGTVGAIAPMAHVLHLRQVEIFRVPIQQGGDGVIVEPGSDKAPLVGRK